MEGRFDVFSDNHSRLILYPKFGVDIEECKLEALAISARNNFIVEFSFNEIVYVVDAAQIVSETDFRRITPVSPTEVQEKSYE